jgi:hypothetical protein
VITTEQQHHRGDAMMASNFDVIDLAEDDSSSSSSSLLSDDRSVWLLYHQKEPYHGSAWSYIYQLRWGPSFIDKVCVGVYDTQQAAYEAAEEYFFNQLGFDESDEFEDGEYFWDALAHNGDVSTLSERVYVEKQIINPPNPKITDRDTDILARDGRA